MMIVCTHNASHLSHHPKVEGSYPDVTDVTPGLFYKYITIAYDDSELSVCDALKCGIALISYLMTLAKSLTNLYYMHHSWWSSYDDSNVYIVQATWSHLSHRPKVEGSNPSVAAVTSGLFYKHITITYDDSRVISKCCFKLWHDINDCIWWYMLRLGKTYCTGIIHDDRHIVIVMYT
jgi:hypothetical protein